MTSVLPQTANISIRSLQQRDLDEIQRLISEMDVVVKTSSMHSGHRWEQLNHWYGILKLLSFFPNPLQHLLSGYVAEQGDRLRGMIHVSPFNRSRTTWRVDSVLTSTPVAEDGNHSALDIGTQLLRHCFQTIWEARTWLIEVNVNDSHTLALYRHNGFQPLAHMTYWAIAPDHLTQLAEREPDLPNLLPVRNADASLLHQLDTVSMPPLVRQVFDRSILDFKTNLLEVAIDSMRKNLNHLDVVSAYVFETQRKAAIGYFKLHLCRDGSIPHYAELTVHPAYTWLYPELLSQMARATATLPAQTLHLTSSDYQPEREEYLEQIGAARVEHTLMMSRSVWHKVRESRRALEGLQLSEVLQSFQPARKPVPSRFSLLETLRQVPASQPSENPNDGENP